MGSLAPRSYNISHANQVGRSSEKSKKLRAFVLKMCIEITSAEITVSFKKTRIESIKKRPSYEEKKKTCNAYMGGL
jgi:hypothetical protein